MRAASNQLCETESANFSIYDWDGDGKVNQVIYVAAGFCGNQVKGYIWPNSSYSFEKSPSPPPTPSPSHAARATRSTSGRSPKRCLPAT